MHVQMNCLIWQYLARKYFFHFWALTLLHSEQLKLYGVLAVLSATGLSNNTFYMTGRGHSGVLYCMITGLIVCYSKFM